MTTRDMAILAAYVQHGTARRAGHAVGMSEQGMKQALWRMREREGVDTNIQLALRHCKELRRQVMR